MSNNSKQKHMDLNNRITIEKGLDNRLSMKEIALSIGKDPSTVSKEVKHRRTSHPHNAFNEYWNKCALVGDCRRKHVCETYAPVCKKFCRACRQCNRHCPDFIPKSYHCRKLDRAPFVCNGCTKKTACHLDKMYYRAESAHRGYRTILSNARSGLNISKEDLQRLDEIVTPLVRQGHSPYMILKNHPEISLSEKTLYNYIGCGALSVSNLDLPKKVVYKPRHVHHSEIKNREVFEGRTYKDYLDFIHEYPDVQVVEMDTVVGCEGSHKVLLTLHFGNCHLMMAFILESKESKHIEALFDSMERTVSTFVFLSAFPIILTDRGGEFAHPDRLECGEENFLRTNIYYCDPMCSWQKPHCEKNHEYIRKVLPKGSSFDRLYQCDIQLLMSHINSAPRESLGGMTPLALAKMMLPGELLEFFALKEIAPDDVNLTPSLLQK